MGNILSDRTTERMFNAVNFVEGMAAPVHARSNRRVRSSGGGGTSLIWINTGNAIVADPLEFGATYTAPAGTATALESTNTFYIATPWNTRIAAPLKYFGHFVQDSEDWYKNITEFAVKPSMNYPSGAGAGITTFTCYLSRSDSSLNLGINTAFPAGIKIILDGFDNVNAGTSSLAVFNGKVFWANYDSADNIIYIIDKNRF